MDNYLIGLFDYIDGQTNEEVKLTYNQLEEIGELLGKIHGSKITNFSIKEAFEVPLKPDFLRAFDEIKKISDQSSDYKQEVKKLLEKYKLKLFERFNELEKLQTKLKQQEVKLVLCHGEPSPGNILISGVGKIYLIDWDDLILAPKEKDLMFFSERLDPVLKGYRKIFPNAKISENIQIFYEIKWLITEVADYAIRILFPTEEESQIRKNLEELKYVFEYMGIVS